MPSQAHHLKLIFSFLRIFKQILMLHLSVILNRKLIEFLDFICMIYFFGIDMIPAKSILPFFLWLDAGSRRLLLQRGRAEMQPLDLKLLFGHVLVVAVSPNRFASFDDGFRELFKSYANVKIFKLSLKRCMMIIAHYKSIRH